MNSISSQKVLTYPSQDASVDLAKSGTRAAPFNVGKPGPRNVTLPKVNVPRGETELEAVVTIDT